jgi:hypothetical protein
MKFNSTSQNAALNLGLSGQTGEVSTVLQPWGSLLYVSKGMQPDISDSFGQLFYPIHLLSKQHFFLLQKSSQSQEVPRIMVLGFTFLRIHSSLMVYQPLKTQIMLEYTITLR